MAFFQSIGWAFSIYMCIFFCIGPMRVFKYNYACIYFWNDSWNLTTPVDTIIFLKNGILFHLLYFVTDLSMDNNTKETNIVINKLDGYVTCFYNFCSTEVCSYVRTYMYKGSISYFSNYPWDAFDIHVV